MSHTSPATYLVWSVISILLGGFLLFHLWSFDRFRCLKWNNGPHSGAFKRVMTYSYMLSVPLIITYATGFATIKYREGFIDHPELGIIPKPHMMWTQAHQSAIFPLMLMFSVAWALEMVTHLEELCFWLFLVNSGAQEQDWFTSYYFRTWVFGSLIAVTYMPLVTIFTRSDPLQSEAYSFLAGSLGSLCLTLWFTPILWTFPRFLANLRAEGVDMSTIVRLTKFQELNRIRIIFRFIFVVPLLILGIDGVRPHNHINESMFWTDLLAVLAGFGCAISSSITLTIFFPRSIEGEIAERDARERKRKNSSRNSGYINPNPPAAKNRYQNPAIYSRAESENGGTYLLTSSPIKKDMSLPPDVEAHSGVAMPIERSQASYSPGGTKHWDYDGTTDEGLPTPTHVQQVPIRPLRPNRRRGDDVELGGVDGLTETNLTKLDYQYGFGGQRAGAGAASVMSESRPINNFTSPIDFVYRAAGDNMSQSNGSRLTFTRH